jgi:large subunit ribosomal protein L13
LGLGVILEILAKGERMKTYTPKMSEVKKRWLVVDAKNKILGRLVTKVATILMGKNKPLFTPHLDTGDYVIVINADKVILSGKKQKTKTYYRYSGYPGGLKSVTFSKYLKEKPEELFMHAVKGMLPKNRLGRKMVSKLFVYRGDKHPHQAQKPEILKI